MVVSVEVTNGLKKRGHDAKFIATGQTGIMVEGDGLPIDCIVADFVSGAAEKLILENQHHEIVVVEGQGSLVHPSYSGVTLSLLHGCAPQALILCYEVRPRARDGRRERQDSAAGRDQADLRRDVERPPALQDHRHRHQQPPRLGQDEAARERERVKAEFGLPACDVFRDGPDELVEAVIRFKNTPGWHSPRRASDAFGPERRIRRLTMPPVRVDRAFPLLKLAAWPALRRTRAFRFC